LKRFDVNVVRETFSQSLLILEGNKIGLSDDIRQYRDVGFFWLHFEMEPDSYIRPNGLKTLHQFQFSWSNATIWNLKALKRFFAKGGQAKSKSSDVINAKLHFLASNIRRVFHVNQEARPS
jgi:hypothetical protein